jgi:two-component system phosphate regulon response regulator PhoB
MPYSPPLTDKRRFTDRVGDRRDQILQWGPLQVDTRRLWVRVNGYPVDLSGAQLRLLLLLVTHPEWVFTREQLRSSVWPGRLGGDDPRNINVLVSRLRSRLGIAGRMIETRRGLGYRFNAKHVTNIPAPPSYVR